MEHPDWLDRSAYPFTSRWWDTGAGRMHYVDEGSGEPVVFIHGVPTWSFNFRHLLRHLSLTHRCIALDHMGFGLSDKPERGDTHAPEALASHVEGLIEGLRLRDVTLVVHDWGGPLGLAYALRHPANVRRLVLFNTWMWSAEGDLRAQFVARMLASPLYRVLEDRFSVTARLFIPLAMGERGALSREVHRHYIEPLRRREDRHEVWALVRAIRHADAWVGSLWAQRERLAGLPALVLWGLKDPAFTRRDLERWTALLRHAQVHTWPSLGHYPHEERPQEVCERIARFLAGGDRT
jgi:haloalkane dehalogenase